MVSNEERTTKLVQKAVASLVCLSFSVLTVFPNSPFAYAEPLPGSTLPNHRIDQVDPGRILDSLTLPEELGRIEERFLAESKEAGEPPHILFLKNGKQNPTCCAP